MTENELDKRRALRTRRGSPAPELPTSSYRDALTGVLTRGAGVDALRHEVDRAQREDIRLVVLLFDVDGLSDVNARGGPGAGDELLACLGAALRQGLRTYDVCVRIGGDEFVCALPRCSTEHALAAVQRVRERLWQLYPSAAVSAGLAELHPADDLDSLVRRADHDLLRVRKERLAAVPASMAAAACGACGTAIDLSSFVLHESRRMTRVATCGDCGEQVVLHLIRQS